MADEPLDMAKATALARQVGTDFGAALTVALAYVGDRLGIFQAMTDGRAMTSHELAKRTGLNERYVREWSATMTAAPYVDYDPQAGMAAEEMPHDDKFDLVMAFNCIHDMANPRGALHGIRRAMKDSGAFLWSEANVSDRLEDNINPMGRALYAASAMHCMTVSLADGGEGLGAVVGEDTARGLAKEAGFSGFQRLPVDNPYHQVFLLRK